MDVPELASVNGMGVTAARRFALVAALLLMLTACSGDGGTPSSSEGITTTAPEEPTTMRLPEDEPPVERGPGTPEETPPVESVRTPEITGIESRVIYEQAERASLDGRDTFFWPDGNIGFTPAEDGRFRFFAANSVVSARTVGTFDDPCESER